MADWNYFKTISIIYGLAMVLKGPMIHLLPERWQQFELGQFYFEKLPRWLWLISILGFFFVAYTWYMHFDTDIEKSWIMSLILTVALIKFTHALLCHRSIRKIISCATTDTLWKMAVMNVLIVLAGAMLLYLGIFIY